MIVFSTDTDVCVKPVFTFLVMTKCIN